MRTAFTSAVDAERTNESVSPELMHPWRRPWHVARLCNAQMAYGSP